MAREEEIIEASIDYQIATNPKCIAGEAFADFAHEMNVNQSFIEGAKWADQHPREGIWDADKVIEWIKSNEIYYEHDDVDIFVGDLRKAMEE